MPIYKNEKNNSWYIRLYVKDDNGKSKQITRNNKNWIGRKGKELAQQEEIRLRNNYDNISFEEENITIEKLCINYLEYIEDTVRNSTYDRNRNIIKTHIIPYLGKKKANRLKNNEILEWHKLLDNYISSKNKPLSVVYKQKIHSTLSTIFSYGCKFHNIKKNIPHIVGNFKLPRGINKKEMAIMTLDEFNKFISYEENEQYKLFFNILFYTGMRRGELLALKWEDIDFNNNFITISKTLSIRKNSKIEKPKTNKSNRQIKMISHIYNILLDVKKENGYVFEPNSITGTTLDRKCKNNCRKSGFNKNMRIHDFRHSFASLCINYDVPIAVISEYLGHENISTTLDIYSHLYPDSQNKLIEKLKFI